MFEANVIQLQPCDPYKDYIDMSNHTYPDIGRSILLMPDAFKVLLSHARQLRFEEEPDYDGLQTVFTDALECHGYPTNTPFDWSEAAGTTGA